MERPDRGAHVTTPQRAALQQVRGLLGDAGLVWAITGSTALALRGMAVRPHDLDLQTTAEGAYAIQRLLANHMTWPVQLRAAAAIRSHFGRAVLAGVAVEIMGDVEKRLPAGPFGPPPNLPTLIEVIEWEGYRWPVLSLSYEVAAYRALGRHDRADQLEQWMAQERQAGKEG